MKNDRTPRTLAESEFTSGYPIYNPPPPHYADLADYVILVLFICTAVWLLLECL